MVQNSRVVKVLRVAARIFLFFAIIFISAIICDPVHNLIVDSLMYKKPSGFFGFTFADWELAWFLTSIFLGGIIFGLLGKKIDYFFIVVFIVLGIWEWSGTDNITPQIWLALIGTVVVSNAIGFALKLLRQRFLPKLEI